MDTRQLIDMLNKDIAEEHAAILRYLIHSYLEGEDTPIGAGLLSRSREEMWHMHWLGMIIGQLGGEPNLEPADYPFDPSSRAAIFKSYVEYEEHLVPHYKKEAEMVDDPHIKRVLYREGWESNYHAQKFKGVLTKLSDEQAAGLPENELELPQEFLDRLQSEVMDKYNEMLQHIRNSWVFQGQMGWDLMDQAMNKMKQLAHFSEDVAENGIEPKFLLGRIDTSTDASEALNHSLKEIRAARERHLNLSRDEELKKHSGLVISTDLTLKQEKYQEEELEDWIKKV